MVTDRVIYIIDPGSRGLDTAGFEGSEILGVPFRIRIGMIRVHAEEL